MCLQQLGNTTRPLKWRPRVPTGLSGVGVHARHERQGEDRPRQITFIVARIVIAKNRLPALYQVGKRPLAGIEMRGPAWRKFSADGEKALFRLPGGPGFLPRVTVCEAAIDALSLAALEGMRGNTLYAATAGGMGPATAAALLELLEALADNPAAVLVAAPLPPDRFNDWNDALCSCQGCSSR
jgi:hypothetical protein